MTERRPWLPSQKALNEVANICRHLTVCCIDAKPHLDAPDIVRGIGEKGTARPWQFRRRSTLYARCAQGE
jgi:hypothetical protein